MIKVRVTLLNGQWFDMSAGDDIGSWTRHIKSDGAILTAGGSIPWHAIASIIRVDLLEQRSVLDTVPEGRPN